MSRLSTSQAWFWYYTWTRCLFSLLNYVSQLTRLLVETKVSAESQILQDILFCFGIFFSFCLWSFHDLSSFLLCPLSSASSLLDFFHCSFLLGALCTTPVHYLSFPNIGFGFPNIIRLILTLFVSAFLLVSSHASSKLRGKCEEIWQSREQYPETWSGKWLNNRASH